MEIDNVQLNSFVQSVVNNSIFLPVDWNLEGTHAGMVANYDTISIFDRAWYVVAATYTHGTAGSSGTLQIEKCASGVAPDSGVNLLATAFDMTAAANTPQFGILTTTRGDLLIKRGERLVAKDISLSSTTRNVHLSLLLKRK